MDRACRVIASQASVPLVYIPLEALSSMWHGQEERRLSAMFKAADEIPGCLVFLDEVDSLATARYHAFSSPVSPYSSVYMVHINSYMFPWPNSRMLCS